MGQGWGADDNFSAPNLQKCNLVLFPDLKSYQTLQEGWIFFPLAEVLEIAGQSASRVVCDESIPGLRTVVCDVCNFVINSVCAEVAFAPSSLLLSLSKYFRCSFLW